MKKIILTVGALLLSNSVFANYCLQSVSNQELLGEVARRLGGGVVEGGAQVSFSCNSHVMSVSLITANAEEFNKTVTLDYSSTCSNYRKLFSEKVLNVPALKIIAMCNSNRLYRLALTPYEVKELEIKDLDYSSTCQAEAKVINQKL